MALVGDLSLSLAMQDDGPVSMTSIISMVVCTNLHCPGAYLAAMSRILSLGMLGKWRVKYLPTVVTTCRSASPERSSRV